MNENTCLIVSSEGVLCGNKIEPKSNCLPVIVPMKKKEAVRGEAGVAASVAGESSTVVKISTRPVGDPGVLARESVFREAIHQTSPLAEAGSGLESRTLKLVQNGNARHPLLNEATSRRLITEGRDLTDLLKGRYPSSTPAEVVVAHDFKVQNTGGDPGIVNSTPHRSPNVVDVRVAADCQSRRDILFLIEARDSASTRSSEGYTRNGYQKI